MGLPERREREKQRRRDKAVEAAMKIYGDEGYLAITMEKIAERAELSRAALYLYFKNKDEIFVSAIVSHVCYFGGLLKDIYNRREQIENRLLDELWDCFKKFYEKNPAAFNASLYFHQNEALRNLSADLRDEIYKSGSNSARLQHKIVEYGVKKGIFIECDHRTLSEVIYTSFLGIMQLERSKRVLSRNNHLKMTQDLALKVLAKGILKK